MYRNSFITPVLLTGALLGLLLSSNSRGADTGWQAANRVILDQHLLPRYERLAESGRMLSRRATRFCKAPDLQALEQLRGAYHAAMDDWMGIQHMRFGPVEMYLRYNRYQLWPDKHGTGAKQLRQLLAKQDRGILLPDRFPHISVAVQGFTSLERLLFPAELQLAEFTSGDTASYRCELVMAIARNIAHMSSGVVEDWLPGDVAYADLVLGAEQGNDYFESSEEVSSRLLNNLHTQLQVIVDNKLLRPMKGYRLRRAESWRSRRSLRNIRLNLKASEELYRVGFSAAVADRVLDAEIRSGFNKALLSAEKIELPLYEIQKGSQDHGRLQQLLDDSRALKRLIATRLPRALGLSLGFNSLDGD
ncbi:imelysin family protein [Candidatus Thiodiazotropha sp. CDECU1]|uniref:imelysin family protein n=1 Tax=Candidatus Thiodiazotropha sp. CDECU1 TaxID=3065865 RepID=UPI00292D37FA|nr:imelysin family protein [Candidatus Thiodiazotropha sp. CDECU1]